MSGTKRREIRPGLEVQSVPEFWGHSTKLPPAVLLSNAQHCQLPRADSRL